MESRFLNLSRSDVCRILTAVSFVRVEFMMVIDDETTTDSCREIAITSLDMWDKLHDEIAHQLYEQERE